MIEACSINVRDLQIFRRTQSGLGGAGTDVSVIKDLRAHQEEAQAGSRSSDGRDVKVTDTLMIDGVDDDGVVVDVRAFDFAQWTDWRGLQTEKLEIAVVAPFFEPGQGLTHVRLDVG